MNKKIIFFDFDGTLTVSSYVRRYDAHAVSDEARRHVVEGLDLPEVVENFGGIERLRELTLFLKKLRISGINLIIISHGLSQVISRHLRRAELLDYFDGIYGLDSEELRACGGGRRDKAVLIEKIMSANKVVTENAIFFEDTTENLDHARGLCQCRLVAGGIHTTLMGRTLREMC